MKAAVLKFEIVGNLFISFTTAGTVVDRDWAELITNLKSPKITKYMATSIGTIDVTSIQRKEVADLLKTRKIPVAVVTEASIVRGVVTAISWMGADIKAVDWPELRKGLERLGVAGSQQDRAVDVIERLKATYGR